jgi:hypothetical protein
VYWIVFIWTLCGIMNIRMARWLGRSWFLWGVLTIPVAPIATLNLLTIPAALPRWADTRMPKPDDPRRRSRNL